jgi:flagellar hook-associated protein 2
MSVEGGQQNLLKAQQSAEQATLAALQSLNTQVSAVRTAVEAMVSSVLVPRSWAVNAVTSSSSGVVGTADASASAGSYGVDVLSVAAAHKTMYAGALSASAAVGGGVLTFTMKDGRTRTVDLSAAATLSQVVSTINGTADLGIRATTVRVGPDAYRLQLSAATSGEATQFTTSGLDPAFGSETVLAMGSDATVQFGPADTDVMASTSNTFPTLFPGVSFTVTKPEKGVVLTVGPDVGSMSGQVSTLVKAVAAVVTSVKGQSGYDAATKKAGVFLGESLPQQVSDGLVGALFSSAGGPLPAAGITLDSSGTMVFDAAAFSRAMTSDPVTTVRALQDFAVRLGTVAKDATDYSRGSLTAGITARQATITYLTGSIADWDDRLAAKKDQLTRQFSALNTTLSTMQNQYSWLSGQFATLAAGASPSG